MTVASLLPQPAPVLLSVIGAILHIPRSSTILLKALSTICGLAGRKQSSWCIIVNIEAVYDSDEKVETMREVKQTIGQKG